MHARNVPIVIRRGNVNPKVAYLAVEVGRVDIILGIQLVWALLAASNVFIRLHDPEADEAGRSLDDGPVCGLQHIQLTAKPEREGDKAYIANHLRPKKNQKRPGHFVGSRRKIHNGVFNSGAVALCATPLAIRNGRIDGIC